MNTLPSAAFVTSNESDGAIQHRVPDAATALSARATGINAVDSSPTTHTISDVHTNLVMSFGSSSITHVPVFRLAGAPHVPADARNRLYHFHILQVPRRFPVRLSEVSYLSTPLSAKIGRASCRERV